MLNPTRRVSSMTVRRFLIPGLDALWADLRLPQFLAASHERVLIVAWNRLSLSVEGAPVARSQVLRERAAQLLTSMARALQLGAAGEGPGEKSVEEAARAHAECQWSEHLSIEQAAAEFAALREGTLQAWSSAGGGQSPGDWDDLARFNAALDRAWKVSNAHYAHHTRAAMELFVGMLAHDIRNPLGTISLCAEYLAGPGEQRAKPAALIQNAAARIAGIVEQVADFTRGRTDAAMPLRRRAGNLQEHLLKVVEEARVRHPGRRIEFDSCGSFQGFWDEGRCGQLLSNLLGNALQYGTPDGVVTVRLRDSGERGAAARVYLSVHNDGPAIPEAERAALFEPLVRGKRGRDGADGGLGLGLFICREIVRAHGGNLTVESDEAHGTTFTATL
jgi:signal transduction histidine kinase